MRKIWGVATLIALLATAGCASDPAPTETATAAVAETPTPTVTIDPAPVLALGGDCADLLSDADATAAVGTSMAYFAPRWSSGATELLGGLACTWSTTDEYMGAVLTVVAYPDAVVPDEVRTAWAQPGCDGASLPTCWRSGTVAGTWIYASAQDSSLASQVWDTAASHATADAAPATAQSSWWATPECADLDARSDLAAAAGVDALTVAVSEMSSAATTAPSSIPALRGTTTSCTWTRVDGDTWGSFSVVFVPGGGDYIATALAADGAEPVDVAGATVAVSVQDNDLFEGYGQPLLVSDGVNLLIVYPDPYFTAPDPAPVAAELLRALAAP